MEKVEIRKRGYKIWLSIVFSVLLLVIIGSAFSFTIFTFISGAPKFGLIAEHWALIATVCLIVLYLVNIYRVKEERKFHISQKVLSEREMENVYADSALLRADFERFKRETLSSIKAHLKVSLLFWIHYYKKERARSFEETKREIFKDLKKEYAEVPWMDEILEELSQEVAKYKNSSKNKREAI